ncbi:MAG: undecaprenyldiphospho-muramoylpentapeptide beta-N-acetylglucosaminyltransferase [Steroidobacteraceae bacterium]
MSATVLIMAGGTGGHVFPALAVARVLRSLGHRVVWLGTRRGIEARLVPAEGIPVEWIEVAGLRGKGLLGWLWAPFSIAVAVTQALAALRRVRPDVVLGCGGFASGPGGVAARLTRTPLVIHEQNAVAGLTNRLLARLATRVAEAFPGSFPPAVAVSVIGNPVRADIAALPEPVTRFAGRQGPLRLLVFGGSQGAAALNQLLPMAMAGLPPEARPQILHQTGTSGHAATEARYRELGVEATVQPFIDDMARAYGEADFAVTRSGALTVSELAAAGLGALLVPFPAAVDDHQARNAQYLAEAGAARMIREEDLTPPSLAAALGECLNAGRETCLRMATAARGKSMPGAAERLADMCLQSVRVAA